jgi:hydroxypyruvate isomerase
MPRFSANVSILFTELPFMERFSAAKEAGFNAVECWFPYEHGVSDIARTLRECQLEMVSINTAPGAATEWGLAAVPGREADFLESLDQALDAAGVLGNCAVHVMGGLVGAIPRFEAWRTYISNLEKAVRRAEAAGVQLLIEPLNSRDRPGYVLSSIDRAAEIVERRGLSSLKIMFDCYHVQVEEGNLATRLRRHWDKIGHIQIACAPDRSEPGKGEIDFTYLFTQIDHLGWSGWIGAEYKPSSSTGASFGWLQGLVTRPV